MVSLENSLWLKRVPHQTSGNHIYKFRLRKNPENVITVLTRANTKSSALKKVRGFPIVKKSGKMLKFPVKGF